MRVRLEGIDYAERGQDFSERAKQFTSDMVFGRVVTVDVRDIDRYGRLVARVSVDRQDVSLALVRAGLAWHFTRYSADPQLAAAEAAARSAKVGLWDHANPIAPWQFRRSKAPTTREARQTFDRLCKLVAALHSLVEGRSATPFPWKLSTFVGNEGAPSC